MIQSIRSALIGIAIGSAALLAVALLDGAFTNFMPSLSNVQVAQTNLATCFVFGELIVAFFLAGYWVRRWRVPLVWLLAPIVSLYVGAIATMPYVFTCNPMGSLWGCAFAHFPFVAGILSCCAGYAVSRYEVGLRHVA